MKRWKRFIFSVLIPFKPQLLVTLGLFFLLFAWQGAVAWWKDRARDDFPHPHTRYRSRPLSLKQEYFWPGPISVCKRWEKSSVAIGSLSATENNGSWKEKRQLLPNIFYAVWDPWPPESTASSALHLSTVVPKTSHKCGPSIRWRFAQDTPHLWLFLGTGWSGAVG